MHHHRAEHWVVVAGTARVTINGEVKLLGENESIYIPLGATHCTENPGKIPLDLVKCVPARISKRTTWCGSRIVTGGSDACNYAR